MRMRRIPLLKKERYSTWIWIFLQVLIKQLLGILGLGNQQYLQHLNALLKPTEGSIKIGDMLVKAGTKEQSI